MKSKFAAPVLILLTMLLTVTALAQESTISKDHPKYAIAEKNLLKGVNSDNEGLRFSSAYFLGEMKSEAAVLPLVRMLRDEENEGGRIIAALSLIKIENAQGVYMVKRTAQFNDNERVRKMSDKFYYAYLLQKYLKENQEEYQKFSFLN